MKKNILFFILGLIIAGSIGVYATIQIQAHQIDYNGTPVDEVLDDLYEFKDNLSFNNITTGSNYNGTSGTSNTVSVSLNKGKYLCFFNYAMATNILNESSYRNTAIPTITAVGCDSFNSLKTQTTETGGTSPYYSNAYHYIQNKEAIFSCNLNANNTVSITINDSSNNVTPWSGDIHCVKVG